MITPPFSPPADGEDDAEFFCLAFAPVKHRQTKQPLLDAALGIYYCQHESYTRFSQSTFAEDGQVLAYSRGDDDRDSLEFVFLTSMIDSSIHPAGWRLFPRAKIPSEFHSDEYEEARRDLCQLLFHFRTQESVSRMMSDLPQEPLMSFDESAGLVAFGDSREEDEEMERAVVEND